MKIAIIGYTGGRGNWGCQSTSRKLVRYLRSTFAHRSPIVDVIPIPRAHELDRLYAAVHGARIESILRDPDPSLRDLRFLESLVLERHGRFAELARGADLVVFQAEGALGPSRLLRNAQLMLLPVVAKSLWGKPVLSMNQTLHAATPADGSLLAAIYDRFDLTAVREPMSLAFARGIGLDRALLCPDLAIAEDEPPPRLPPSPPTPGYFCVTGSASLEHYDLAAFAESVRRVSEATGLRPLFLYSRLRDDAMRAAFFPDAEVIGPEEVQDYTGLGPLLSHAAFTLGGRYHTSIAGLIHGTPALVLPGNNPKAEGLVRMVPVGVKIALPRDAARLAEAAAGFVAAGESLRRQVHAQVASLQQAQSDFAHLMRSLFAPRAGESAPPPKSAFAPPSPPLVIDPEALRLYGLAGRLGKGPGRIRARISLALARLRPGLAASVERSFVDLP